MQGSGESKIVPFRVDQLPDAHARQWCRQCSCVEGYLARLIYTNGTVAIRWVCDWCEDYKTSDDLPRTLLQGISPDELPLREDRSAWDRGLPECAVCGQQSQEFHHWAPQSVFPDWPGDLGVYLCIGCHVEWHTRMRAHGFRYPHELQAEKQWQ